MAPRDFKPDETTTVRLPRVSVDFKIPAWGLACAAVAATGLIAQMWFTLNAMQLTLADVNTKLTTVLAVNAQLAAEQLLLKYRVDNLEAAKHQAK